MSDLGDYLREGREAKGLTLAQAVEDTHIRRACLEALEEGARGQLPDEVYSRGLAATYARYLELDEGKARSLFDREYGSLGRQGDGLVTHEPLDLPLRLRPRRGLMLLMLVLVLGVLAGAAAGRWPPAQRWGRTVAGAVAELIEEVKASSSGWPATWTSVAQATATSETPDHAASVAVTVATPTSAALPYPTPTTVSTPTPTVAPMPTPTVPGGLRAQVEVSSAAWVRVSADGEVVYEGIMQPGDRNEWSAQEALTIRTGNAGGTAVTINGEGLGAVGAPGEVVELQWVWRDGDVVLVGGEG